MPRLTLDLSDEVNAAITELARKKGVTKAELLRRGIALLAAAEDARKRGLRVGAADVEGTLKQEWLNL